MIPVGECYRCGTVVEPMLSDQWFVKMEELAKPAIEAAKSGKLEHVPDRFEKIYLHWLEEIRDWCISRQLWWGAQDTGILLSGLRRAYGSGRSSGKVHKVREQQHKSRTRMCWTHGFSSALWPFSTLGWPDETEDLKYFYPTDVLVTGYDIIFFLGSQNGILGA